MGPLGCVFFFFLFLSVFSGGVFFSQTGWMDGMMALGGSDKGFA